MQTTRLSTTELGETGLEITCVGFGAWAIGGAGYDWGWGTQEGMTTPSRPSTTRSTWP
jgi:aryl-alcohol dehydrogenase-like predicted oxidoreductase